MLFNNLDFLGKFATFIFFKVDTDLPDRIIAMIMSCDNTLQMALQEWIKTLILVDADALKAEYVGRIML